MQCHNALEHRASTRVMRAGEGVAGGKVWRQHQLLGALEVQVPIASVETLAAEQRRVVLIAVVGLTLAGLLCLGLLVRVGTARARALTDDLAWRAAHDDLTGLVNRPRFQQRLQAALDAAKTDGSRHALMFLDLDQFKVVNDTCGHRAGDELLRQLAAVLRAKLRAADTLARLGGDEFGVLLADCPLERAGEVADKLLHAVADYRFPWNERVFELGVSIGLVEVCAGSEGVAELMSAADIACYAAKEAGRHRVRVFQSSDCRTRSPARGPRLERAHRRSDGQRAHGPRGAVGASAAGPSAGAQLPGVAAAHVRRGRHTDSDAERDRRRRALPPDAHADRPLGVADGMRAYPRRPAARRPRAHRRRERLRRVGRRRGFPRFACDTVLASGIDPQALCFEITETAAIRNFAQASAFITTLKALGCRFALDDFGSGLSSFGYLKNLPVDFLKLDGAFVRDIITDQVDRAMVGAIHDVGRHWASRRLPSGSKTTKSVRRCDASASTTRRLRH